MTNDLLSQARREQAEARAEHERQEEVRKNRQTERDRQALIDHLVSLKLLNNYTTTIYDMPVVTYRGAKMVTIEIGGVTFGWHGTSRLVMVRVVDGDDEAWVGKTPGSGLKWLADTWDKGLSRISDKRFREVHTDLDKNETRRQGESEFDEIIRKRRPTIREFLSELYTVCNQLGLKLDELQEECDDYQADAIRLFRSFVVDMRVLRHKRNLAKSIAGQEQ